MYIFYTLVVIFVASTLIDQVITALNRLADINEININIEIIIFFAKVLITPPQLILNYIVSKYLIERKING